MSQQFNYYLGRLNDLSDKRVSNQLKMWYMRCAWKWKQTILSICIYFKWLYQCGFCCCFIFWLVYIHFIWNRKKKKIPRKKAFKPFGVCESRLSFMYTLIFRWSCQHEKKKVIVRWNLSVPSKMCSH